MNEKKLYEDIVYLIEKAKTSIQRNVNSELVLLYWSVGKKICEDVTEGEKGEYGKSVIKKVSKKLEEKFGRGFCFQNVYRMISAYKFFNDFQIFVTVSRKLSWSHLIQIIGLNNEVKREFYITMCINENWSVRTLRERINSALFERTAISKKPDETISNELKKLSCEGKMSTNLLFKDPYVLDFLDLQDNYNERDLEAAIIKELEKFMLEIGTDFAFIARQKRITIGNDDYYIDLLFFHRKLRRLVIIELKLEKFKPEHKGQVELYLKYLNKYERQEGEEKPIAIILCADKNEMVAKLLDMEEEGIQVSEYITKNINENLIQQKFAEVTKNAKAIIEQRENLYNN
jgi:predicted nuclease of restriction endonuclease-like (RecB) superfamily